MQGISRLATGFLGAARRGSPRDVLEAATSQVLTIMPLTWHTHVEYLAFAEWRHCTALHTPEKQSCQCNADT